MGCVGQAFVDSLRGGLRIPGVAGRSHTPTPWPATAQRRETSRMLQRATILRDAPIPGLPANTLPKSFYPTFDNIQANKAQPSDNKIGRV